LFLFGDNRNKQLGIEDVYKLNTITNDIFKKFNIDKNKFKKIKCGYDHNLILIEDDGNNKKIIKKTYFKNFYFYFKKKIEKKKENIFGFGSNEDGELGFSDDENSDDEDSDVKNSEDDEDSDVKNSSNLIQISFFNDKKIKDFCCGVGSSYVLIG
jgi:alpha-tubulin suppressor-like RCC1 family protein